MPEPIAHLHRYKCDECGDEWETTSEYDDDAECGECGHPQEATVESIPLYAEAPALVELLRELNTWAETMGGWDSQVWAKSKATVAAWDDKVLDVY